MVLNQKLVIINFLFQKNVENVLMTKEKFFKKYLEKKKLKNAHYVACYVVFVKIN